MARKYECQQCGASFSKLGMLINHRRQFGHKDIYPCTICQKTFGRKDNLERHKLRHQDGSLFQCNDCVQFVLDESLEIEITHVELPSGGTGRKCKFVDLDRFLKEKKCIIRIKNHDDICCARALVTAKANHEKHEQWDNIRRGFKIQEQLAAELYILAKVPHHKCGIEEIKQFQTVMPEYQINVVSKDHFNGIIYK
ncbi:KRAB [Mytilus coruscus]|uniref:KRAB n=1 Tax=Mytilus coruscus TaxID=42192 RepID=A0A6J8BR56_MYTCO|nr:KRAB [Mytilus coruscus]